MVTKENSVDKEDVLAEVTDINYRIHYNNMLATISLSIVRNTS